MKTVLTCGITASVVEGFTTVCGEVLLSGAVGKAAMVLADVEQVTSIRLAGF